MILFCPDKHCDFHKELPVCIVDEEIYKNPPTILFGTVDKFALIPWKSEASRLFASDSKTLPPELIIQDELHLISGPLGTMVGLYESIIDALCSSKGIRPKIVASTATIRRADEQCKALYARAVKQFPPAGLNLEDSFFAKEIPLTEQPGRLYVGLMSSGKPQTTTIVRLMGAVLQAVQDLDYSDEVKDVYWTFVGYFNTLKELGQCVTLVNDDIKDYVRRMAMRKGKNHREFYEPLELTSRVKASEIPDKIEELQVRYPDNKRGCVPILLASSMMSTGVDIGRLGLMAVIGQPKTTSEYIQASSRIGREYPGLVFTLYDGARPRDRSHYEHFVAYHNAFYNFVEPTSVTPFSGPARERALHALLVSFLRHNLGFTKDEKIKDVLSQADFEWIINYIGNRVEYVDEKEKDKTIQDLRELIDELITKIKEEDDVSYGILGNPEDFAKGVKQRNNLMSQAGQEKNGNWETLTSMRNVDTECNLFVED